MGAWRTGLLLTVASLLLPVRMHAQINTDRMLAVGQNALYFDDYVLSIQYFNQVINAKPYLYEPYFYRAIAKLSLEDFRGAEQDCTSSIERNPFVVNSYQVRGLAYVYQQKYDRAIADFREGLRLDPENRPIRHNLILSLARDGRTDEALLAADTLLASYPKYSDGMAMKSDLLWEAGDSAASLEWIDKAVGIDRYNADLLVHRAVIKARMEMYADAMPDLNRAVYLDPGNVPAYMNRAMVNYCRDSLNAALADYDMVLRIEPSNVTGHYNRGNLRAQIGDDNRAITDFDFVIDAEPDNWMAIFNRAILRDNTGDWRGAEQDLTRVLNQYPEFVMGYQLRSDVREKLGDATGAEKDALVVLREQNRRFNRAMGYVTDDEDDSGTDDSNGKTRGSSDKNVRNYRKIIVDDELENATGFSSEYRGRVQNRNVDVKYLEPFRLTYFRDDSKTFRRPPVSRLLDDVNNTGIMLSALLLDNEDAPLDVDGINRLFDDIEKRTEKIAVGDAGVLTLVARALDFYLLQDFQSAMDDIEAAGESARDSWLVWLARAQIQARMIEAEADEKPSDVEYGHSGNVGYRQVVADLSRVLELEPDFAYAWYNRGTFYARDGDLRAAIVDLDKAISLEPEMAQAWYNRGVVLVLMNRVDEAIGDLSKAGELGIVSAYNIIKRFSKSE